MMHSDSLDSLYSVTHFGCIGFFVDLNRFNISDFFVSLDHFGFLNFSPIMIRSCFPSFLHLLALFPLFEFITTYGSLFVGGFLWFGGSLSPFSFLRDDGSLHFLISPHGMADHFRFMEFFGIVIHYSVMVLLVAMIHFRNLVFF